MRWLPYDERTREEAIQTIAKFRATFAYPLRAVTYIFRRRAIDIDPSATVYSRTKRMVSIATKLERIPTTKATTMQDVVAAKQCCFLSRLRGLMLHLPPKLGPLGSSLAAASGERCQSRVYREACSPIGEASSDSCPGRRLVLKRVCGPGVQGLSAGSRSCRP